MQSVAVEVPSLHKSALREGTPIEMLEAERSLACQNRNTAVFAPADAPRECPSLHMQSCPLQSHPARCDRPSSSGWVPRLRNRFESGVRVGLPQVPCGSSNRNLSQSSSGSSPKGSCCWPEPPSMPKASSTGLSRSREFDCRQAAATSSTLLERYAIGSALR